MTRRSELPTSRRHIMVFDEDWEWLKANYGPYSHSRFGVGPAIQQIIHRRVREMKQREVEMRDQREASEARNLGLGRGVE